MKFLDIARNMKENVTLGELLGPYEGRIGEKECVVLLGLMAREGLMMGCLYFFKWMGVQEPSLITPAGVFGFVSSVGERWDGGCIGGFGSEFARCKGI